MSERQFPRGLYIVLLVLALAFIWTAVALSGAWTLWAGLA